jgi:chromosomal replication initiator protein
VDKGAVSNLKSLWDQTVSPLKQRMTPEEFETWIRPMAPVASGDGTVEISVPNSMFAAWVRDNFLDDLAEEWTRATGRLDHFRFVCSKSAGQGELFPSDRIGGNMSAATPISQHSDCADRSLDRKRPGGLLASYGFESFVTGPGNQFARAAAIAVAGQPGTLYNPFFLFGGVGLGKTHLVNAIGNAIMRSDPTRKVAFMSADTFTNRLIEAIAANKAQEFKNRMRRVDVLILDDVQFLAGRERTQEEFFHIFNALYESGRQIVLTSDKFPNEIQRLEERLCSRFGWGLVADIQPPDEETRVAILERKARDEGVELPIEVARFIASRFEANIRDLEGALTRVSAWASLHHCLITLQLARQLLGDPQNDTPRTLSLEEIADRVASHFGLRPGELQARRRTRKVSEARQVCMYLMRHQVGASFPMIGEFLGGRDHSTVVHGCQTVDKRRQRDARFRHMLENLIRTLPAQKQSSA